MTPNNHVHIIGGGVIGLCSAWYLREAGFEVTVVNDSKPGEACSFGNAGYLSPSHFVPLAAPGLIAKGLMWMAKADSPFHIHPRLHPDLLRWLWGFYRASTPARVNAAIPVMRDICMLSRALYKDLSQTEGFDFDFDESGLLMLCQEKKAFEEEIETAEIAHSIGMEAVVLDPSQLAQLEPDTRMDVIGGVLYPSDVQIYPNKLMHQLDAELRRRGVRFIDGTGVTGFGLDRNRITSLHLSDGRAVPTDRVVAAAGSRTALLLKKVGVKFLLQDGKGYSVTVDKPAKRPRLPAILHEARVAVSPMGEDLRLGGTLEISNHTPGFSRRRVEAILKAFTAYYPDMHVDMPAPEQVWHGYRPCSPDGLPYIGTSKRYANLTVATGHAMLGLTMGAATGKLVSELLTGRQPSVAMELFRVDRYGE